MPSANLLKPILTGSGYPQRGRTPLRDTRMASARLRPTGRGRGDWRGGTGASRRVGCPGEAARAPFGLLSELAPVPALVVLAVLARADRLPPPLVLAVPLDRLRQPLGEAPRGLPAELPDLRRGQRIAPIVARAVRHVLDEGLVAIGRGQDAPDDVDVGGLVRAAHVVDLARQPLAESQVDRPREVLDVEPVAHLMPVAVHRQRVAGERVQ